MKSRMSASQKLTVALLCIIMVLCCTIGGTVAWLLDTTSPVVNTFTVGDVEITLKESPYDSATGKYSAATENVTNSYPLIPGNKYKKDPVVAVDINSEDCWLFVQLVETNNPKTYLDYTLAWEAANSGWTLVTGETNVYYREVKKTDTTRSWDLLKTINTDGMTVTVKETIVKTGTVGTNNPVMPTAGNEPQLTFIAYAVQTANRTVDQAWAEVAP